MILVDTSVLIGFFKESHGTPYKKFDYIIDNSIPYGICHYVYQELLQGVQNEKEFTLLKEYLSTLPFYELKYGKESFENAALIDKMCRKKGITITNTIDLLITEIAVENNLYLLHDDNDFVKISKAYSKLKIY